MKNLISIITLTFLLTACGSQSSHTNRSLDKEMENPLFAERYSEELVERMVELMIHDDPILQDEAKSAVVDKVRTEWLQKAKEARKIQREGTKGNMISMDEYTFAEVLYVDDMLYFGPSTELNPGPSLHVFMTTVVDPRDTEFPDETALDLGTVESAYGAQSFAVPAQEDPLLYRTVVLWDTKLERLYGFAQLNK